MPKTNRIIHHDQTGPEQRSEGTHCTQSRLLCRIRRCHFSGPQQHHVPDDPLSCKPGHHGSDKRHLPYHPTAQQGHSMPDDRRQHQKNDKLMHRPHCREYHAEPVFQQMFSWCQRIQHTIRHHEPRH